MNQSQITITSNIIPEIYGLGAEAAVVRGISSKPGPWKIKLSEFQPSDGWRIRIKGPDGYQRDFEFQGPEQAPDYISKTIEESLAELSDDIVRPLI